MGVYCIRWCLDGKWRVGAAKQTTSAYYWYLKAVVPLPVLECAILDPMANSYDKIQARVGLYKYIIIDLIHQSTSI
jgi:hypothetical protein